MPEDDDPTLQHIPRQFGIPNDDFNWPWYWERQARLRAKAEAEADDAFYRVSMVAVVLCLLVLVFIVYACSPLRPVSSSWPKEPLY